jgi:nucleoside-diphosphate-sugar epimerase
LIITLSNERLLIDISPLPMAETGETRPMSWENPRACELSEVASETVAGHISEWSQIPFTGLRFSNIHGPGDYQQFPECWPDAGARRRNRWGCIDERDAAMACRLALEALARGVGESGTLLAIDRARAALGFTPQHSWRDHLDPRSS